MALKIIASLFVGNTEVSQYRTYVTVADDVIKNQKVRIPDAIEIELDSWGNTGIFRLGDVDLEALLQANAEHIPEKCLNDRRYEDWAAQNQLSPRLEFYERTEKVYIPYYLHSVVRRYDGDDDDWYALGKRVRDALNKEKETPAPVEEIMFEGSEVGND